jgi:hypothetical protein
VSDVTLTELVSEIQEKYPHGMPNDKVVKKMDDIQKRVFRIFKKLVRTEITTIAGQKWYDDTHFGKIIRPGDIRDFVVGGMSYPYKDIADETGAMYYFYVDGKYGIVPEQVANTKITIFHYHIPATLNWATTSMVPEIDEEFQNILVYGACKEIAENFQDFDAANGYAAQYNYFLDEFLKYNKPNVPATIREEWWG